MNPKNTKQIMANKSYRNLLKPFRYLDLSEKSSDVNTSRSAFRYKKSIDFKTKALRIEQFIQSKQSDAGRSNKSAYFNQRSRSFEVI